MLRRSLPSVLLWLVLLAASSAAFFALRVQADWDRALEWASPVGHFWVVSAAALACFVLAAAAGVAAFRARNARVLMLSLAFLSMAGLFSVHGLATPGVMVDRLLFNLTGLSARLALMVSVAFLAASTIEWPRVVDRAIVRWRGAVLGAVVMGCLPMPPSA